MINFTTKITVVAPNFILLIVDIQISNKKKVLDTIKIFITFVKKGLINLEKEENKTFNNMKNRNNSMYNFNPQVLLKTSILGFLSCEIGKYIYHLT